jgi:hypothetical protein
MWERAELFFVEHYIRIRLSWSWSAVLLLVVLADGFKFLAWKTALLVAGYLLCADADQGRKDKDNKYEFDGWVVDPEDPDQEIKGNFTRVRLTGENQIIVTRVGELLRRTP